MSFQEPPDVDVQTDVAVCEAAVNLLRARERAGLSGDLEEPDVERILHVIGRQLDSDPNSIPVNVRAAAIKLAEDISNRFPIPAPRRTGGHAGSIERARGEPAHLDRRSAVPFARSIRLGRMG
jgi:hypothetical protein